MTEDEAKTKWCPFARVAAVTSRETGSCASANRDSPESYGVVGVDCIASACMAWRLTKDGWRFPDGRVIVTDREPQSGQGYWVKRGYCGLAGAPQ